MAPSADVRAVDALREWIAALATYRNDVGEALSGIRIEISRGTQWVNEQLSYWQRSIRHFEDAVVQAKAELAARRFPDFDGKMPDTTLQERNLRKAIAQLEMAEAKVVICRRWLVQLPKQIDEVFTGAASRLANCLEQDLPRGIAVLTRQVESLEQYTEQRIDLSSSAPVIQRPISARPEEPS
jgi:hypothetical protein